MGEDADEEMDAVVWSDVVKRHRLATTVAQHLSLVEKHSVASSMLEYLPWLAVAVQACRAQAALPTCRQPVRPMKLTDAKLGVFLLPACAADGGRGHAGTRPFLVPNMLRKGGMAFGTPSRDHTSGRRTDLR